MIVRLPSQIAALAGLFLVTVIPFSITPTRAATPIQTVGSNNPAALKIPDVPGSQIWKDPAQPVDARVRDLVSRMSLAEKTTQLRADAPAIPRLGIHAYSYRNECLHGEARTGIATVFPQAIGMAATWDAPLIYDEADVIATEARAKFNDYTARHNGNSVIHFGVSFYAPNINIFRDPRWGRGQETYGEDPFLSGAIATAFIRGLQGDDPKYIKALACAKHYAVHSGPEPLRTYFDARPPERDLYETYLPAFETAVREGHVGSVMGAYSALYGIPACANPILLTDILRHRWNFQGFVVSDGGAILENYEHHKYAPTPEDSASLSVKAGCDLFSGKVAGSPQLDFEALGRALHKELLSEKEIDTAVSRTLAARFRLGLFDPPSLVPWSKITLADNDTPDHLTLALKVARESIVLLKNDGLLPLDRAKIRRIAVIGGNAHSVPVLVGNYNGTPSNPVTILEGIREIAGAKVQVVYSAGCPLALKNDGSNLPSPSVTADAVAAAKSADVVIYVGGIDASLEGEERTVDYQGFDGGDRTRIELPTVQEDLLKALFATGKPVVFVNCSGCAMAIPWAAEHLPAIVQAWYPGEQGGRAVAEVLFGDVNPAARLPVTFYRATADLPPFDDYSMSKRTYRYFNGRPLYAFGHGLSYTKFDYENAALDVSELTTSGTVKISFAVKNTSDRDGDEVPQVYFPPVHSTAESPKLALCGFTRIQVPAGRSTRVTIPVPVARFRRWDTAKKEYVVDPGAYELLIGAASDDIRLHSSVEIK